MSSTSFIYLVNKETKVKTYLFKLCATPARTLGREVYLVYDEETLLTKDFFTELCEHYKSKIKEIEEDTRQLLDTLAKATTKEVVDNLYGMAQENNVNVGWLKEEIQSNQKFLSNLKRVWEIYELNDDYYNLYYYFA